MSAQRSKNSKPIRVTLCRFNRPLSRSNTALPAGEESRWEFVDGGLAAGASDRTSSVVEESKLTLMGSFFASKMLVRAIRLERLELAAER